jgi:hypothetical protein
MNPAQPVPAALRILCAVGARPNLRNGCRTS